MAELMSLVAIQHLNEMKTKSGFDGTVYFENFFFEDHVVKGLDHLTPAKFAQVATLFAGRAGGVFFRKFAKIRSLCDLLFEL